MTTSPKKRIGCCSCLAAVCVVLIILVVVVVTNPRFKIFIADAQCASNEQQLGVALAQYCQDNDASFPAGANHWAGDLYPYVKSTGVYECPVIKAAFGSQWLCTYAMNANLPEHKVSDLDDPSHTVALAEYTGTPEFDVTHPEQVSVYTGGSIGNAAWGDIPLGTNQPLVILPLHNGGDNYLACDGHVHFATPEQVSGGIDSFTPTDRQNDFFAAGVKATNPTYVLTFSEK